MTTTPSSPSESSVLQELDHANSRIVSAAKALAAHTGNVSAALEWHVETACTMLQSAADPGYKVVVPVSAKLHDIMVAVITDAVVAAKGNKSAAARTLGIARQTLVKYLPVVPSP